MGGRPGGAETRHVRPTTARRTVWSVVTVLSTLVGAYAVALVASGFDLVPDDVAANSFFTPLGLRLHITGAAVALLVGPWQFVRGLRSRAPAVHRTMGHLYVAGVLVGGVAGGAIALGTASGPVAGSGFLALAVAWLVTTAVALQKIRRRDVAAHQRWMLRSFALTFAAVTLRLYLGITGAGGVDYDTAYRVIAWVAWVPNLVVMELWVRSRLRRGSEVTAPRLASVG